VPGRNPTLSPPGGASPLDSFVLYGTMDFLLAMGFCLSVRLNASVPHCLINILRSSFAIQAVTRAENKGSLAKVQLCNQL
jgi:hypothetical protein